jgi:membrane protease YdiL (CAAX protease family)
MRSNFATKHQPSVGLGMLLYLGYLAIFFSTWAINGVDYNRIGQNVETTKLWYAFPTLFGCAFLVVAITRLGWWRITLFDRSKSGPLWVWLLPAVIGGIILNNFLGLKSGKLSPELLLWSTLGAVGVGFGEEMITRGSMIVGLRSRYSEVKVWLISTALFSALHGLWDSSLFLSASMGVTPSAVQFAVYPLAIACAIAVLLKE